MVVLCVCVCVIETLNYVNYFHETWYEEIEIFTFSYSIKIWRT